jgi:uncharacterized protein YecT (DUF1311 family)
MTQKTRARLDDETLAWIAYYDAQAKLFAELADGSSSDEQKRNFREQENRWREKARALQPIAAE